MADVKRIEGLEPWVSVVVDRFSTKNLVTKFPGYSKAYILSLLRVFHREFGEWPTPIQIAQIVGYRNSNKAYIHLRGLEDEGYIRLDETRRRVVEIIKEPYIVPRPDYAMERINGVYRPFLPEASPEGMS